MYRTALTYSNSNGQSRGKTSDDTDVVKARFLEFVPGKRIVYLATFESDDPAFAASHTHAGGFHLNQTRVPATNQYEPGWTGSPKKKRNPMTTLRNRYTMISATLALGAALLASASAAQATGGGAMGGIRTTGINTVSSGPVVVNRDHRGNKGGEGGVTVTVTPGHRPCPVACSTGPGRYPNFVGRVYDHRSH